MRAKVLLCVMSGVLTLTLGIAGVSKVSASTGNPYVNNTHHRNYDNRIEETICTQEGVENCTEVWNGAYIDADEDGICDNWNSETICTQEGVENCTEGWNGAYIDADGDGVCDNWNNQAGCQKHGHGMRHGCGGRGRR